MNPFKPDLFPGGGRQASRQRCTGERGYGPPRRRCGSPPAPVRFRIGDMSEAATTEFEAAERALLAEYGVTAESRYVRLADPALTARVLGSGQRRAGAARARQRHVRTDLDADARPPRRPRCARGR